MNNRFVVNRKKSNKTGSREKFFVSLKTIKRWECFMEQVMMVRSAVNLPTAATKLISIYFVQLNCWTILTNIFNGSSGNERQHKLWKVPLLWPNIFKKLLIKIRPTIYIQTAV